MRLLVSSESLCKYYERAMEFHLKEVAREESIMQQKSKRKEPTSLRNLFNLRRSVRLQGREPDQDGLRRSARLREAAGQASMSGAKPGG